MNYIRPIIGFYDKFDDLDIAQGTYSYFRDKIEWDDIFSKKKILVLAEPGYGKTRMLKEIVIESSTHQKDAIFLDLKMVSGAIDDYIKKQEKTSKTNDALTSEEAIIECQNMKSKNFVLTNSKNIIICFDALDEVQVGEKFAKLINDLSDFIKNYDQCSIIISCRTHHYKRYKSVLADADLKFCKIFDFENEHIESFLKQHISDKKVIVKALDNVSRVNCQDILGTPRYLSMFAKLVKERGIDGVLQLNRIDLFEAFIYGKLEKEACNDNEVIDTSIVKRVLEKLALIMEIYQSNTLTKDELLTYFDNIDSNLSRAFLEVASWQVLRDKSLIKDNLEHIQFENREFQEYLAAKELTRIAKNEQALYDLVVDAELKEVIPSWFNTLGFFIEIDISKLKQFIELGKHKPDSVQDVEYHKLLTFVKTDRLDVNTKREIFEYVFNYYQKELIWLDLEIAEKLAFYYEDSFAQRLKTILVENGSAAEPQKIKLVNAIRVARYLFKYNKLGSEREPFKISLVKCIKVCDKSVQSEILDALKYCENFDAIEKILSDYNTDDERNLEHLIYLLTDMKPNSEISLNYFIKGAKHETLSSRYGLYKITDSSLIESMLRQLIADETFLESFVGSESVFCGKDQALIRNIKNALTPSLLDTIEDFIIHVYKDWRHDIHGSQYARNLLDILKTGKENALFSIISKIKDKKIGLDHSMFADCFRLLLNEQNVEQFINEIVLLDDGRQFVVGLFWSYPSDSEMHKKGKETFAEKFAEYEKKRKEYQKQYPIFNIKETNIYEEFKHKLGSKGKSYYTDLFEYYLRNAEELDKLLTTEDTGRFEEIVFEILTHNPLSGQVTFENKQGTGRSYTITQHLSLFPECLNVAKKRGWDLTRVRQNILNCIPSVYYQQLDILFECIGDVADLDIGPIMEVYTKRKGDDLERFMPESFIRACERYNIISAIPILGKFIDDSNMELQDRRLALEVYHKLKPDREKVKTLFNKWHNDPGSKQLAEKANELLIEFNDTDAIIWRINEIKKRALKVAPYEYSQMRFLSSEESELHGKNFARPLLNISHDQYSNEYIDLLDFSFMKAREHNEYSDYVSYIWDIVCSYFYNLRTYRKYDPVLRLEKFVYEKAGEKGTNWFKYRIQKLKREYSSYISKPDDILTCIQKYNKVVSSTYLFLRDDQDLIGLIKTAINEDLRRFVEDEGYYREIGKAAGIKIDAETKRLLKGKNLTKLIELAKGHQEDLIQKTLKMQLENTFLKKGLRNSDIIREPQLLDDKRPDFLISYGFLGPVLIEIKTTSNKEIRVTKEREAYKPKLQQYVNGFNAVYAFFLIFQVSNKYSIQKYRSQLNGLYDDFEKIGIIDLNCIKSIKAS